MPDNELKNILGDPENKTGDLNSILGEPELKKKDSTPPIQKATTPSESKSDSVTPLANLNNFYPPTDSETPSIKSKQSQIIQNRTKEQFLNNPLFQETNPNAEKNKKIYIDTLVNKGYNKGDLELVNKATTKAKQQPLPEKTALEMTEGELSRDFWSKTSDAFLEGTRQVKEAFTEPLKTESGKVPDANTPITEIDYAKPVLKAAMGITTSLASPIIAVFDIATKEIKNSAEKTLPEPAAKIVGEALPTIFSLAHKAATALGYKPEVDSNGDILLSFVDMMVGGKVLHTPIKGYETIKSIGDLKEISQKAAKGELSPEEMKSYEKVVDEIKNTSLADIKKTAEESNTSQGDVIASEISEIEQPSLEHKVSPEIKALEKQKADLESDKQKLEEKTPGAGSVLDNDINEVNAKLEEAHNVVGDMQAGEGLNNVIHSELDTKIGELEASKEGLTESGKESIDKQIQELKTQKDALQVESPGSLLQHPQEGIRETGGERGTLEQGVEGDKVTKAREKEKGLEEIKPEEAIKVFDELDVLSKEPTSADRMRIKEIYDTNPKIAEVNRRFKEITKQLESEGKLTKICP